jgi:hypothetical protein
MKCHQSAPSWLTMLTLTNPTVSTRLASSPGLASRETPQHDVGMRHRANERRWSMDSLFGGERQLV